MRAKSEVIRKFIIDQVEGHPKDIARLTAEQFSISRQAVNRHIKTLIEDGVIVAEGNTKERVYSLRVATKAFNFPLAENKEEDRVWHEHISPLLVDYKENVMNICYYGFTEMFNNAIDHSGGSDAAVKVEWSARAIKLSILDNGIGIFEKIKSRFNLVDHREAVLELSKGKLTTDPNNHSGQGIFFTSRMFDKFLILSNRLFFSHEEEDDDWLIETRAKDDPGTLVDMEIAADTRRMAKEVFDKYTDLESDDYAFSKTHVPLSLARYDEEQLISRSQAKRVLARFERFKEVFLDFHGVESIGQAFADEIFRVFRRNNPGVRIIASRANQAVNQMIKRAESSLNSPSSPVDPP